MKIKNLEITNFKRFTNLKLSNIPATSKLVLLIGSNGSGKSSIFDSFDWLSKGRTKGYPTNGNEYYRKNTSQESSLYVSFHENIKIRKVDDTFEGPFEIAGKFFGRSSIRIVPRINNNSNVDAVITDSDSPHTYIDNDSRFLNDISLYINQIDFALREPVFKGQQADTLKIFQDQIKPLNDSLVNIFGGSDDTQIKIAEYRNSTPNTNAQLIFRKGESKINYDLLSHGEKQVVILLLNFLVRKKYYDNSIIFIDEMDCHLNTTLQYKLLEEIVTKWIPDNSQLWTASHALGFIDFAKKSNESSIIDLDLLNFDLKQEIYPDKKESIDIYEIAIPKNILFEIIKGKKVFCENQNDKFYQLAKIKDCIFIGLRDSREIFLQIKRDTQSYCLRDRDFLMDVEIERLKAIYPNYRVLGYYNFENYMYHPDNIAELKLLGFSKEEYTSEISEQRKQKYEDILERIISSRMNYEEFKTDNIKENSIQEIKTSLKSDEFEVYYKYFDMKTKFSKKYLEPFNLTSQQLCQTDWFKSKIEKIV